MTVSSSATMKSVATYSYSGSGTSRHRDASFASSLASSTGLGLEQFLEVVQDRLPALLGDLLRLLGWEVGLGDRQNGAAVALLERPRDLLIVLRTIRLARGRAPMRVHEGRRRLEREDRPLVLVGLALPFASVDERAPDPPVGLRVHAEEPPLDQLRCGQRVPDLIDRRIDRDRGTRREIDHDASFRAWPPCSRPSKASFPVKALSTRTSRTVGDERDDEHHGADDDAGDPDPQPHARTGHEASLERPVPLEGPDGAGGDQPDAED